MNRRITINGDGPLAMAHRELNELYKEHKYFQLSITIGKKRSLQLNALSHSWYSQVSDETGEYTPGEVKARCKLFLGLPILRGDDEYINSQCMAVIDPLGHEEQIIAMDLFPVTSLMTAKQVMRYLTDVQNYMAKNKGVILEFPEKD